MSLYEPTPRETIYFCALDIFTLVRKEEEKSHQGISVWDEIKDRISEIQKQLSFIEGESKDEEPKPDNPTRRRPKSGRRPKYYKPR